MVHTTKKTLDSHQALFLVSSWGPTTRLWMEGCECRLADVCVCVYVVDEWIWVYATVWMT